LSSIEQSHNLRSHQEFLNSLRSLPPFVDDGDYGSYFNPSEACITQAEILLENLEKEDLLDFKVSNWQDTIKFQLKNNSNILTITTWGCEQKISYYFDNQYNKTYNDCSQKWIREFCDYMEPSDPIPNHILKHFRRFHSVHSILEK